MLDLLSNEYVIKMVSTTKYEAALIEDNHGYFVAYSQNDQIVYGRPFRDYSIVSAVFDEICQQLEGN